MLAAFRGGAGNAAASSANIGRSGAAAEDKGGVFERLEQLVSRREQGILDDEEFKALKSKMLAE